MSPGDVNRFFGRFTWGTYSPAGTLERNGFFWRQLRRRRRRDRVTIFGYGLWVLVALPLLVGVAAFVVSLFR